MSSDFLLGFVCLPVVWLCFMVGAHIYDKAVNYHYKKQLKYEIELYEHTKGKDDVEDLNKKMDVFIKKDIKAEPFTMSFSGGTDKMENIAFTVKKEGDKITNLVMESTN